jgi:hypothetical protein
MARTFLRSRLVQDEAVTAGGPVMTHDLPVNPLSVILYTIRAEVLAANTIASLANLLAAMSRVEIVYKGQNIVSASLADLYAMAYYLRGTAPHQGRKSDAAAAARVWITVPIMLSRRAYWLEEAFPAVRRGELQLQSTPATAFTNITNVTLQVETVELLEATPARFTKYTTISKTPTAIGDHDVDLPIGNPIVGVLLFGTTVPVDGSFNASVGQLRLLVDNVEQYYALTNWESLKAGESIRCDADWQASEGSVRAGAAVPVANELFEAFQWPTSFLRNYAYLDFDPLYDLDLALMTEGRSRVHLRINADVADAIRVLPVEMIAVAGGAA